MSQHGKLRENKSCENCGYFVEKRFCPECGQENVETRQRFHYLFTHFVSDFLHYDGRFWKTILYLLFRPAKLTKEYLAGKRKQYMPPVTLYIFICFITFFIPPMLPELDLKENTKTLKIKVGEQKDNTNPDNSIKLEERENNDNHDKLTELEKQLKKVDQKKLEESIIHDFPKAIFFYMPFFAFWLWVFHNKKKWYYFDHGIYTLHFFSFILLGSLFLILITWFFDFIQFKAGIVKLAIAVYFIYYFFHSHRLVYQESKALSRLKCSFLFIINSFFMLVFFLLYIIIEAFFFDKGVLVNQVINSFKD